MSEYAIPQPRTPQLDPNLPIWKDTKGYPRIAYVDAGSRVHLRLYLLDPDRTTALVQIHSALGAMCSKNREGIREALKRLRDMRKASWPIDDHLRAVEAAHREYVNEHYGDA